MRTDLNKVEIDLLEVSAKEILQVMNQDSSVLSAKQKAFIVLLDNGIEVQVQVQVTKEESEFIDDFVTEIVYSLDSLKF